MSDWYYDIVWYSCAPVFTASSAPVVLHRDRVDRPGAFILAANHLSPFDVPCLMKNTSRRLDFVSIVEVFRNPLVAWFYGNMNAFPLDRGRVDSATTRVILDRLRRGRVVALFPEGAIRSEKNSVLNGGPIKPGVVRIAALAKAPIVPVVIVGTRAYRSVRSWFPIRRTRYGINFGEPIEPDETDTGLEDRLRSAYAALYAELKQAMDL